MPMLIDTEARSGHLVRAVNDILIETGPAGLTMRNIARVSRVSTSSIYGQMGSREHLLRVAAATTARARFASLDYESSMDGVLAFVPRDGEEVLESRSWLGWLELWRAEDFLGRWIAESRADERALLARITDYELPRRQLDELFALIEGLRTAVCAPVEPMRLEAARTIVASRCHTLTGSRVLPAQNRSRRTA